MKIAHRILAVLLFAVLALATTHSADAANRGGTLTFARNADSLFLDPVLNQRNVDIWILTNLYDTLLQPSQDGRSVEPGLASEYKIADDGLSVTLKLRPDLKFADGSPLTVEDVQWSLDRARNPKNGTWNFLLASVDSVAVEGSDTVTLRL